MKRITILFAVLISWWAANNADAQRKIITLANPEIIKTYLEGDYRLQNKVCENIFTMVKFQIDSRGYVINLDFSRDTPALLKDAIQNRLSNSNGFWKVSAVKENSVEQPIYVLPMIFMFRLNCLEGEVIVSKDKNMSADNLKELNSFILAFSNALKFEKSNTDSVKCVLFSPMVVNP
ncbi:hypothetical protein [Mucilaginibacter sp.]|uniref:hypothetical protein n=1 Tax=Mucilaginibacter sp. TaxID=1882438 RepID=UPI0035BBF2F6